MRSNLEKDYNIVSDSEDEPFKPFLEGLPITRGLIIGYPALMLIYSGADITHIPEDFCKRACKRAKPALYQVQIANKSTENMKVTRKKVTASIGSYFESFGM